MLGLGGAIIIVKKTPPPPHTHTRTHAHTHRKYSRAAATRRPSTRTCAFSSSCSFSSSPGKGPSGASCRPMLAQSSTTCVRGGEGRGGGGGTRGGEGRGKEQASVWLYSDGHALVCFTTITHQGYHQSIHPCIYMLNSHPHPFL